MTPLTLRGPKGASRRQGLCRPASQTPPAGAQSPADRPLKDGPGTSIGQWGTVPPKGVRRRPSAQPSRRSRSTAPPGAPCDDVPAEPPGGSVRLTGPWWGSSRDRSRGTSESRPGREAVAGRAPVAPVATGRGHPGKGRGAVPGAAASGGGKGAAVLPGRPWGPVRDPSRTSSRRCLRGFAGPLEGFAVRREIGGAQDNLYNRIAMAPTGPGAGGAARFPYALQRPETPMSVIVPTEPDFRPSTCIPSPPTAAPAGGSCHRPRQGSPGTPAGSFPARVLPFGSWRRTLRGPPRRGA